MGFSPVTFYWFDDACDMVYKFLWENPVCSYYDPTEDNNEIVLTSKVNILEMPNETEMPRMAKLYLFYFEYDSRLEIDFLASEKQQ